MPHLRASLVKLAATADFQAGEVSKLARKKPSMLRNGNRLKTLTNNQYNSWRIYANTSAGNGNTNDK
jgi:hypothetical protein